MTCRKTSNMEFSLTEDEMKKIQYLGRLERKKHRSKGLKDVKKFSDQLSLEAQIAMQMALKDTQAMKRHDASGDAAGTASPSRNHVKFADEQKPRDLPKRPDTQCSKHSSFSDTFQKRGSERMESDITDEHFEPSNVSKRSLDGTKVQNALETVEIINADAELHVVDDDVIEQIAQRNSVEKCLVWMEVLAKEGQMPKGQQGQQGQQNSKEGQMAKGHQGSKGPPQTPPVTKSARSHRTQETAYNTHT